MPQLLDTSLFSVIDTNSSIGVGWKLNFYTTGTSTRKNTYPTEADALSLTNAHANPIVLPADGRLPSVWLTAGQYKCVLTDAADVVKETVDPINETATDDEDSFVTPEQFGAVGDNAANDLPAWRAMVAYAKLNGIKSCRCAPNATYAWWAPTLTGNPTYDAFDVAGPLNFLTISHNFGIDWNFATVNLKAYTGGSIQTVTQNATWDNGSGLGVHAWRGSAISVIGGTSGDPNSFNLAGFWMKNGTIDCGCDRVTGASAAAEFAYSDLSHKGFRIQDTWIGKLQFENMTIKRARGEIWYLASSAVDGHADITLDNCRGYASNQSALNPSSGKLTVIGGEYGDAPIAVEALGGPGHTYIGTRFYNAWQMGFYGAAGYNGFGATSFTQPTNLGSEAVLPWITFDNVVLDNCVLFDSANYMRGTIRAIDTNFNFSSSIAGQNHDIQLEIDHTTHKLGGATVTVKGPATTTTAYGAGFELLPRNIAIRVRNSRSKYAIDNTVAASALFAADRLVDQESIVFECVTSRATKIHSTGTPQTFPRIILGQPIGRADGSGVPLGATQVTTAAGGSGYTVTVTNPHMSLINSGAAGIVTISMATTYTAPGAYVFGQRVRISMAGGGTGGTTMYFPKAGTGLALNADRRLTAREEWLELEFNSVTGKWREVAFCALNDLGSTTEVLTGTDAEKPVTSDALAALWEKGADITSAATISVGEGGYFHVAGNTGPITDIDPATDKAGRAFWLVFDSTPTLTHNATTLILPTGANIVAAAGDMALFVSEGSDAVRCVDYVYYAKAANTGWTTGSGTPNKGAYAAYAGQNVSAAYVEAEAQATDDAAKLACQRVLALEDALRAQGIVN